MEYAVLYFLPWMRRGLASAVTGGTNENGVPNAGPSTVMASVSLGEHHATRDVQLQGPGAVVGVNEAQVLRCFPAQGTVDIDHNNFVHIELRTADLPWMFTPGAARADRLIPWLALVVVEEREGVEFSSGAPLPVLRVDEADLELPSLQQSYAWAHVQCTTELGAGVEQAFETDPEAFTARLVAPRRLRGGIWYRACLVPSFRAGCNAGLGRPYDPADVTLAWDAGTRDVELPVYYSWRFRTTAEKGDFETLVSRLKARTLPGDAGVHDLDLGSPGSTALPHQPGVVTGYLGVFLSPRLQEPAWPRSHRERFQEGLRKMLNEGVAESAKVPRSDYDPLRDDAVVAPPLYGAQASDTSTLARGASGWLAEANLDPAQRAVAGLGAEIVRRLQESLMAEAWDQAAAVREANAILNRTRLALEVGKRLAARAATLEDGRWLQWSRGAHPRLKGANKRKTLYGELLDSALPRGIVSAAFRRRFRAGTTISRAFTNSKENVDPSPAAALTTGFVDDPPRMLGFARYTRPAGIVWSEDLASLSAGARRRSGDTPVRLETVMHAPRVRRSLSAQPLTRSVQNFYEDSAPPERDAVRDERIDRVISPIPVGEGSSGRELRSTIESARRAMDPVRLLAARIRQIVRSPAPIGEDPVPAALWIDPQLAQPLYEDLARLDPELLLPGVADLPKDSVALARLNTAFVEAFLLGANYELGREFVWREFPADLRGTWLRTFWDAVIPDSGAEPDKAANVPQSADADILRVAEWKRASDLGSHCTLDPERTMVLIIKGDLLQRYPNTLIYAAPAMWVDDDEAAWERVEDTSQSPVYPSLFGKLGTDVTFIGLEFPPKVAVDADLVGSTVPPGKKGGRSPAGWFFAFEQLPEEPHFGLDTGKKRQRGNVPRRWEQLSWAHALGDSESAYVNLTTLTAVNAGKPPTRKYDDRGRNSDWEETWAENSAAMARITWQRPVRMLMHADQMLRPAPNKKPASEKKKKER